MKYAIAVFLGAVSYGILSTIVVKAYGQGYQLGEVVGSQLLVGFALSWLLALFTKMHSARKRNAVPHSAGGNSAAGATMRPGLTWKQRLLLMSAGMPTALTGLLYYQSLRYIPNSLAIILLFQFTWMGVLMHALRNRKRPSNLMLVTLAVLFGGTLLAAGILDQGLSHFDALGVVLGLLAAVSYSLFVLFSGKAVPAAEPAYRSAWMITGGLILVFILFPPVFLFNGLIWGHLLLFGLLLGLFGAFIPPVLFAAGVPHIGEGMAAILGASELPVAVMLSAIVLHERVSTLQWVGVVLVLLGVALPELVKRRPRTRAKGYVHSRRA
ncbi:EamA family transporter [Paenibacillus sacheonensis]|uniref:EamA family transporter n=1 Tax=Paenibacillus sacheonensis TaxID=742054 RepID=A0A7X5BX56_9BACL|nr:EamA family transporter [Paenibacillus sacheonensis]MBM7563201.1 drug/metabolite transporter (DMT)-like permease [Paenibacillus sacheonensis]NBC68237.1 EamA family transporter [Paenibacillus sacheonensis]